MPNLSRKIQQEKPWVIMGMSRKQYERARPWKAAPKRMSRNAFENLVRELGYDFFKELRTQAEAESLVEAIFGKMEDLPE
jgi:hypothetical protein